MKVLATDAAIEGTVDLGYPEELVRWIGLSLLVCTVLYVVPRTAVPGAILLTGYPGGAIATQVRLEESAFLFPAVLAVLIWLGLCLRAMRVRALMPW